MKSRICMTMVALLAVGGACGAAAAQAPERQVASIEPAVTADASLPEWRAWRGQRYLTGGIGLDEARAMRAQRKRHDLSLMFVLRDGDVGQFASRVGVLVQGVDGETLLDVVSDGPFLIADLPAGHYRVWARTDDGRLQQREVDVVDGRPLQVTFEWPVQVSVGPGCDCAPH